MLYFKESEFDRYARYHSWGSARETFTWEDMNKVKEELQSLKATTEALSREIASVTAANGIVSDSLKERCNNLEEALSQTILRSCFNDTSQNQPSSELVAATKTAASPIPASNNLSRVVKSP